MRVIIQNITKYLGDAQYTLDWCRERFDYIGPLLLRLYLVPVFWVAGQNKWNPFEEGSSIVATAQWFDKSLGMPFPTLCAYLAWGAEYIGAALLALGLMTRWACLPLLFTMIVAAGAVHWQNGWQAVHSLSSPYPSATAEAAAARLDQAEKLLQRHGNLEQLTEHGRFVVLNNGIEWAATYFVMLVALFYLGGGRLISLDYWIGRLCKRFCNRSH